MKAQERTMLDELKIAAVAMDDAVTDIVSHARDICEEVADVLEQQEYDWTSHRTVHNQIDRLRWLADQLTERKR